ncbi:unnamed protein product [Rotaria socialis]|uniref:Transposase domain-containing protein n=1 Tax=Rotaria socialis TaxID=392032 RepID=A0A820ZZY4_9BILA|nr:unnamed protein product [Rotaria socialis]
MLHDDEVPLRSAKNIVRRLRAAGHRLSRNDLLSSMSFDNSTDTRMLDSYADEDVNRSNQLNDFAQLTRRDESDDRMLVEQDEEQADYLAINEDDELLESASMTNDGDIDDIPTISSDLGNENDVQSPYSEHNYIATDSAEHSPSVEELSTVLALFRHRHKLSKSCINDLCDLLRSLGVKNVPLDFRCIEKNLKKKTENILQGRRFVICSKCSNRGGSLSKCENIQCNFNSGFMSTPTTLCTFKILPELIAILERHNVIPERNCNQFSISDVQEGHVRCNILHRERVINPKKQIVTLLLNSDGIVLKKFNRSVWVTCMVINELPRAIRFDLRNVIICSISMGGSKPKKNQFQSFIEDWVIELQHLELGFHVVPPNLNGHFVQVHAYLIAASLDKPAQALLLNLNDPTGFYSCVRCTIQGISVPVREGTTRVFIRKNHKDCQNRSNELYDKHLIELLKKRPKSKASDIDPACGQQGPCLLRKLYYFNIGPSFTTDSLHNVYSGTFKRLLEIWFKSRRTSYSIHKHLPLIESRLDAIRYPSTTYHLPSQLKFYTHFKGNEYRLVLLFGYQYFKPALPLKYFQHLKLLAFAMNLAESFVLHHDTIEIIRMLLDEFDHLFSQLYSVNSMTSVVHSMVHVHESLKDFGPLQNYSTFNFESVIGSLVQSVNGPSLVIHELVNNINILQAATEKIDHIHLHSPLRIFIARLFSTKRQALPKVSSEDTKKSVRLGPMLKLPQDHIVMTYLNTIYSVPFHIHETCWKNKIRFSIYNPNSLSRNCDSCLLFKNQNNETCYGFVVAILNQPQEGYRILVNQIQVNRRDSLILKGRCIINPFIFWGHLTDTPKFVIISLEHIIVKLAYRRENDLFHFFQFPNTVEST